MGCSMRTQHEIQALSDALKARREQLADRLLPHERAALEISHTYVRIDTQRALSPQGSAVKVSTQIEVR
jgi:hypothetical protein